MKLYDLLIEIEDLDEAGNVRKWLKELVKHYKNYHKPAKAFKDADIILALGGKIECYPYIVEGWMPEKQLSF